MLGPLDFPQVVHGKIQWSTTDGRSYDIQFDANDSPCWKKEAALLHVVPGKVTTCAVVGTGLFYPYAVAAKSSETCDNYCPPSGNCPLRGVASS